ncbi:hypothetical protein [Bradyrhizobium roseum]|uniref:hypothetical protein n=1 Tax=Bradyrhizobium roseum TaxID=3056648 RepID=UPI0026139E0B|nr:hypothetical protein [Bradyrhizobium roseus]WKA26373.1 hypothetical protein QUH67_22550 [Bradyrhizobium roseus]
MASTTGHSGVFTATQIAIQEQAQKNIVRILARQQAEKDLFGRNTTRLVGSERVFGFLAVVVVVNLALLVISGLVQWILPPVMWVVSFIPAWLGSLVLLSVAVYLGRQAWLMRDEQRSPYYPILEMAVGLSIAVTCSMHAGFSPLGVLAFLGGLRIIVDAFRRWQEFKTTALLRELWHDSEVRFRYLVRCFKKFLRATEIEIGYRLDPKEFDHVGRRYVKLAPGETLVQVWLANQSR